MTEWSMSGERLAARTVGVPSLQSDKVRARVRSRSNVPAVVDREISTGRVRDDLRGVHRVAVAVPDAVAVARGTDHITEDGLNAQLCRHRVHSADPHTSAQRLVARAGCIA